MKNSYKILILLLAVVSSTGLLYAQCDHSITITDSYGDGWDDGHSVTVNVNGAAVSGPHSLSGAEETFTFSASGGDAISLSWTSCTAWSCYDSEVGASVIDGDGNLLGAVAFNESGDFTASCPPPPSNPPVADFSASTVTPGVGAQVTLTDLSTESPSIWSWSFSPSTVSYISGSSTSQNPVVSFDVAGTYDVTLIATNVSGSDSEAKSSYITVSCGSAITVNYDDVEHCNGNTSTLSGTIFDPNVSQVYTLTGMDSYGDGWNGYIVDVLVDGEIVVPGFTLADGSAATETFTASQGSAITFNWQVGSFGGEISFDIDGADGTSIVSNGLVTTTSASIPGSSPSYTYAWSPSTDLDDATSNAPVSSATTNQSHTLTVTSNGGCSGTDLVEVVLNSPSAGTLSGTTTIAPGESTTLNSDGTSGGEWTSDNTAVATVDLSTGVVTAVSTGSATITYAVGGTNCPDASTIAVTVACASEITVSYDDVAHCSGESSTFSGTISDLNAAETYTFNTFDSYSDTWNGGSVVVSIGGVTVVSTDGGANGNSSLTFSSVPGDVLDFAWVGGSYPNEISFSIQNSDLQTVASGNTTTTQATLPGSPPTYTYSWTPSTGLDDSNSSSPETSATSSISYTISVQSSNGCTGTTTAGLTISNPTAGTLSGTTTMDLPGSTTLSTDGSTGGVWSSDDTAIATVDASSGAVTAVSPGSATITYAVGGVTCPDESTITVTVSNNVILPVSGNSSVTLCSGTLYDDGGSSAGYSNGSNGSITIYPATAGAYVNIAGTISFETCCDGLVIYDGENTSATQLFNGTGSGTSIDYTSSDASGALTILLSSDGSVNADGIDLTISCVAPCSGTPATPTASITATDNCAGTSADYAVTGEETGSVGLSYDWESSSDNGTTWTSLSNSSTSGSTTLDNIQIRFATTCSNSGLTSYSNTIVKLATAATSSGDITVCPGDAIDLAATVSNSSSFDVEWYAAASGGTALATGSPYSPSPSVTTTYYAASSGCPNTRVAVIANVSELTSAYGDASTCTGVDATLTGTYTGNGVSFSWSPNTGLNDATAAIPTSSSATGLTYTLTLTDDLGCSITDDVVLTITESTAGTLSATSTTFAVAETSTVSTDGTTGGTFATSDASVATVDASTGVVTGVTAGTVTITYTTPECSGQSYSNTIDLTIACEAGSVSLTSSSVNIGETSTASSTGTAGGSWSSDNTAVATVDASTGVVTGVTAGVANITYTTSTACGGQTASTAITITCSYNLTVAYDDVQHCSGATSTLSGSVADPGESYTYSFNGADSYGDGWGSATASISVDGTEVVSGFGISGADGSTTFSAGVGSVITLSWTTGSWLGEISWDITDPTGAELSSGVHDDTNGGTTSYSNATFTYSWSPSTDLDDATSASPAASNTTTETYTVTISNTLGCTGTDDVIATVSNPTAGTLSGTQAINVAATTTISSDGTAGGEWTSSDVSVATVDISTGVVTGVTAGTADITYTVGGTTCPDASTIAITVSCASDLTVSYDDVSHCSGNSSLLSGSVNNPNAAVTYTLLYWDSYGDGWGGGTLTVNVAGTDVGTYSADASNDAGGTEGTASFSANFGDAIILTWGTPDTWTGEYAYSLTGSDGSSLGTGAYSASPESLTVPGTAPTYTYAWTPSTGLDDATIASPTASNTTTETYTITVTSSLGCTGTDDVIATVSNPTAGTLSGTTTIAPEGTTTISSDGTSGGVWESDDTAVATVDASTGVVTGGIAGSATITYTVGGTACPDASTITVNVVCNAYTVVYGDVTFCDGTPTTLSQTSNSQNSTYEFYGVDSYGDGWNGASVDISVNGVTVLTGVEVTASTVSAYFDAPAGATIGFDWTSGSYNSEISWGLYDASVNLLDDGAYGDVSSSIPGSAPTYTYSWSPSTGLDDASIMEPTSSASSTTVYTVTVTDGFGCVATDDVTATVNPLYTPSVSIVSSDADNEICSGDAVTFTATAVDAGNPTYVWNIGGSPVSGETASTFTTTTLADGDEVTVTITADNTCQTVNEVTSTGITTTVNAVTAGTIEASVDGATTYASTPQVIQVGNDIYWEYTAGSATGTFSSFEFQWQGTTNTWNENFGGGANPYNWGAGQTLNPGQTLYVRAKAACGSNAAYSDPVAVDWLTCYGGTTEIATSTSDGGSIVDGGNMTVNSTISWTAPTDAFGDAYHWEYSWDGGSSFNGEWQNNTNPATWSDNIGSQADNTLTIRYVSTGSGSCSDNATADFDVTVLRPVITVSAISGDLAVCSDGEASSSETFTVEGLYIANDDNAPAAAASHTGILVTAPSGLEISTDNSTFSSTINLSATNGTVSNTTIYARIIAGQSASDVSGDIACTAQAANTQNVSAVATIDENAEIETSVSFTGTTTCGEVSIDVQVNGVSAGSGAWTALSGLFLSATDVATTFTTSTFGSTITLTWTSSNGACTGETTSMDVEFNQPTTSTIDGYGMDTESWIWGGLTDDDWSEPSNWYAYTTDLNNNSYWERQTVNVPSATDKVYIMANSDAGQCISSSNSAIATPGAAVTDLMVANGATLNLSGATSIKGDLTNDGTINAGSSTLTFDGTSDQTVSGNALTLDNLTVNKTSGNLIMSTPINVNGLLDLSSDVNNGSNVLSVGTSSASLGSIEQNGGIVLGKLRRYFANASGSKSFPVGIAGTMRDVAVDFVSAPGTDQYITASYNTGYPQANDGSDLYEGLPLTTSDNQLIQNYDDEGYWEIIPGSSSTGDSYIAPINGKQYNVTLHCNNLTGADNVTNMDRTKVRMIKSAGPGHTSWEALTHVSISGDDADFLLTATGTGFSFFGAGTEDDNALPVELISFSGDCNDGVVDLIWQTASEQNSEDFEIEYSRDGVDWSLVHAEPAAGFSNELITYNFSHKQAISGNNYYRLTQNDIDGTATIYNNLIINASCQSTSNGYFSVFPNPSSGNFQVIMNNPEIEGAAQLRIVDTKGNEVFMKSIEVNSGINMFVIQQDLAPGIYYINIENSSRTTNVVKHSIR